VRRREHPSAAAAPGTPPVAALVCDRLAPQMLAWSQLAAGCDRSQSTKALTPGSPAGQPGWGGCKVSAVQKLLWETIAVFTGDDERLDHLSLLEVATKLV
jgi:hypothetical protein